MIQFIKRKRKEKELQKELEIEVVETLISLSLAVGYDRVVKHNSKMGNILLNHAEQLGRLNRRKMNERD